MPIELVSDRASKLPDDQAARVIDAAREYGLLVIECTTQRNVIRFLAHLGTTDAQLQDALNILDQALAAASQTVGVA